MELPPFFGTEETDELPDLLSWDLPALRKHRSQAAATTRDGTSSRPRKRR